MKVLVATREKQGVRANDFCHADEGEVVTIGFQCDGESVDGHCGCRRTMCGLTSHKATTTMKVADMPHVTVEKFVEMQAASDVQGGWYDSMEKAKAAARPVVRELLRLARTFLSGMVVEKRGSKFQERR